MGRVRTFLLLAASLAPLAAGASPIPFDAQAACTVDARVSAQPCLAAHSGSAEDAFCRLDEWFGKEWCGVRWQVHASFSGPDGLSKRMTLRQSWEGHPGAMVTCDVTSSAPEISCDKAAVGLLVPLAPGGCAVLRIATVGDMPPVPFRDPATSPVAHAEAITRVQLCRDVSGVPALRPLD